MGGTNLLRAAGSVLGRALRRLLFALIRSRGPKGLVVRQLRAEDLPNAFPPIEMRLGAEWLARQARGDMYVAVAELRGTLVGRNCIEFNYDGDPTCSYLFAGTVQAQWRSRGVGARLVAHLRRVARSRGARAMYTVVRKDNPRSLSWLERQGYRRVGEGIVCWTEGDGRRVEADCWKLQRPLTSAFRRAIGRA